MELRVCAWRMYGSRVICARGPRFPERIGGELKIMKLGHYSHAWVRAQFQNRKVPGRLTAGIRLSQ